jgi:predicted RNase H-like nuclease (RuvC/YqgF family)
MNDPTKFTVAQVAKMTKKSRPTIYRHIEQKPISTDEDENGSVLIEASELIRVYGTKINFDAIKEEGDENVTSNNLQDVTKRDSEPVLSLDDKIQIIELKSKVENLETQLESKKDENEYVKKLLEEEKADRKKANILLEDQRERASRDDGWQKELRAMEQRVANNEKTLKEETAHFDKIRDQNKRLKRALDAEKNKTIFRKLFPKKNPNRRDKIPA